MLACIVEILATANTIAKVDQPNGFHFTLGEKIEWNGHENKPQ